MGLTEGELAPSEKSVCLLLKMADLNSLALLTALPPQLFPQRFIANEVISTPLEALHNG